MKIISTKLSGIRIIETLIAHDPRGDFMKIFHKTLFEKNGLISTFAESYYSTSKKNVVRGMHFQTPPEDHAKVVYVTHGEIMDVVLDIRKGSPTYGEFQTFELNDINHKAVYISSGFAHGFISLRDNTTVTYLQSTIQSAEHEGGILFDSFGMNWQIDLPILSDRDRRFPIFKKFDSPFLYNPKP